MARTPDGLSGGGNNPETEGKQAVSLQAGNGDTIKAEMLESVADADISRDGQDLVLTSPDGTSVVIEGYFNADPAPMIVSADGHALTPELVNSFVQHAGPVQYAQAATASDASPVGAVQEITGKATVTHADGSVETITLGTKIFEGDIIETEGDGAVNILFADETSFAVSENARLAIDEYVYDPATQSGSTDFSVLRGMFVFTSGLIGRDDPDDVSIHTPVGSIGIRGTIIAGNVNTGEITVVEGAIVLHGLDGKEMTLAGQYETARFDVAGGEIVNMGTLSANDVSTRFSSMSGVATTFFSTVSQTVSEAPAAEAAKASGQQNAPDGQPVENAAPDQGVPAQNAPAPEGAPQQPVGNGAQALPPAPMVPLPVTADGTLANIATYTAPVNAGGMNPVNGPAPLVTAPPPVFTPPPVVTAPATVTPPPATGGTGTVAPPPLLELVFSGGNVSELVATGTVIGMVQTTLAYPSVSLTLAGGGAGLFNLVNLGGGKANIVYVGAAGALDASVQSLYGISVTASLPDGRTITRGYSLHVIDLTHDPLDLSTIGAADGYVAGIGSSSGLAVSWLGDTDRNGTMDFGVLSDAGNGTIAVRDGSGALSSITNLMGTGSLMSIEALTMTGVGDVNGDGYDDYLVGAPLGTANGTAGGGNFVLVSGYDGTKVYLNGSATNDSAGHTEIMPGEQFGYAVAGLGDVNNDGFDDYMITAPYEDLSTGARGASYVIYGSNNAFSGGNFDLDNAIKLVGPSNGAVFGASATGVGDFNNDGIDDFVIGAPGAATGRGEAYLVFGVNGGLGALDFSSTTPTNFIKLTGLALTTAAHLGDAVEAAGDYNGDGISDLLLAAPDASGVGVGFLLFGKNTGTGGTVDLTSLTAADGIKIIIDPARNMNLVNGSAAGDFNGDGYDDFTLILSDRTQTGTADSNDIYVVYGRAGSPGVLDLAKLNDPAYAFHMTWNGVDGDSLDISSAGDVNGDGYDDLLIGAPDAAGGGQAIIVYGRDDLGNINTTGTATRNGDALVGTAGVNTFSDMNGANIYNRVSMNGGSGNDTFDVHSADVRNVDGGAGFDVLNLFASTNNDFSQFSNSPSRISGIEKIVMNTAGQTLRLGLEDIFSLLQESSDLKLRITDNSGGATTLSIDDNKTGGGTFAALAGGMGFTAGGTVNEGGVNYDTYTHGAYTLMIDQNVDSANVI